MSNWYSFGDGEAKTHLCWGWDTVHRAYSRLGQYCRNSSTSSWSYWTIVLRHRSGCQHNSFCSTNFFSYLEERKKEGIGEARRISKGILKQWASFERTLIRAKPVLTQLSIYLWCYKKNNNWEIYSLIFGATKLGHYVAVAIISFTWLSTPSPSNNSPLLFGSNFLISNSWCFNTAGQCCKYNCIKIHPKSNKRSTIKPLFGIFQHYSLKKTPNRPHEVVRKGQTHGLKGRWFSQRQCKEKIT